MPLREEERLISEQGMGIDFEFLYEKIRKLDQSVTPAALYNPFSNTSLTNQINQEIRDLKNFARKIEDIDQPNKLTILIQRLAQAYVSIQEEAKEANVFDGRRLKAIQAISDSLSRAQKTVFDEHVRDLQEALYVAKYGKRDIDCCGITMNSKSLLHPMQSIVDTYRSIKRNRQMAQHNNQNGNFVEPVTYLMTRENTLKSVSIIEWAIIKYAAIDKSIREKIKLKLFALGVVITGWSLHHVMAAKFASLLHHGGASHAATLTAPSLPVMGADPSLTSTGTGSGANSAGSGIAAGVGGAVTMVCGAFAACCDGVSNSNCDNCGNCVNCCSSGCGNCGNCADCCSTGCDNCGNCGNCEQCVCDKCTCDVCNVIPSSGEGGCDALCNCLACNNLLNLISECGRILSSPCCNGCGNVSCCCDSRTVPTRSYLGDRYGLFNSDNNDTSCYCNPCDRQAHSEADIADRRIVLLT